MRAVVAVPQSEHFGFASSGRRFPHFSLNALASCPQDLWSRFSCFESEPLSRAIDLHEHPCRAQRLLCLRFVALVGMQIKLAHNSLNISLLDHSYS